VKQLASKNDIFGLLLAGLDEQKSAELINDQLRNQVAQQLDKLVLEFKLDESKFANLSNYLKGVTSDLELAKKEALELSNLMNIVNSSKNFRATVADSARPLIEAAAMQTGNKDFTVVRQNIDSQTKQVKDLVLEYKDLDGILQRVKVSMSETGEINVSDSIKVTSTLNQQLKEQDQILQKLRKEYIALNVEKTKKGATPEIESKLMATQAQIAETLSKRQNLITKAREMSLISVQTETDLLQQQQRTQEEFQKTLSQKVSQTVEADRWAESTKALKEYAKIYNEVVDLDIKRSVQGDSFSSVDQERRIALDNELTSLEQLINRYPELRDQLEQIKEEGLRAAELKLADEEVKQAQADVSKLNKLYTELYDHKLKIEKGKLQNELSAETEAHIALANGIEKEIKALEERLRTRNQTTAGEEAALKGLAQVQEEVSKKELLHIGKVIDLQKEKEQAISKIAGDLIDAPSTEAILKLGQNLETTSPSLTKFAQEMYGSKAEVRGLTEEIDNYGNKYHKIVIAQDKTANQVTLTTLTINQQTGAVRTLGDAIQNNIARQVNWIGQMGHAIRKMSIWGVAARGLYGSVRQISEGFNFVKELDKDLTQAAIVTGQTRIQVSGLAQDYADLGLAMGKTVSEISKVNTELLRQGLTVREASNRLETVLKLSATGQITTEESLRVITTAVNAMQESHTKAADVLLKASNISASSVEQLGEAFTKTASSAYATGMEIEQVTALLATMLEVTQEGPSQIGTSLKTILARFSRVNEETGEWNENLNDVQAAIESVGIRFLDADGQIRNVYDTLADLAEIWPTLTKNQQAYIATTAAGTRMQNRFFAIMNNFDRVKTITEETGKAAGTMNRAYLTYMDSVEAASNQMRAALEQLYINTVDSGFIKDLYNIGTNLIRIVDQIGVMNVAVMGLIGYLIKQEPLMETVSKITNSMFGIDTVVATEVYKASLASLGTQIKIAQTQHLGLSASVKLVGAEFKKTAAAALTAKAGTLAAAGAIGLVVGAIAVAITAFKKYSDAKKEEQKRLIELNNTYLDHRQSMELNKATLEDLGSQYEEYIRKIERAGTSAKAALTGEEYQEFIQIQEQIMDILPNVKTKMDQYGNTIIDMTGGVQTLTNQYAEFLKQLDIEFLNSIEEIINNNTKDIKKVQEEIQSNQNKIDGNYTSQYTIILEDEKRALEQTNQQLREKVDLLNAQNIAIWVQGQEAAVRANKAEAISLTEVQKLLLNSPEIYQQATQAGITSYEQLDAFLKQILATSGTALSQLEVVYSNTREEIEKLNQAKQDGLLTDEFYENQLKQIIKAFDKNTKAIKVGEDQQNSYNAAKAEAIKQIENMKIALKEEEEVVVTLAEQVAKAQDALEDYIDFLDEYKKYNGLTLESKQKIIDQYPEFIKYMDDEKLLIQKIKEARIEADKVIQQSYEEKINAQLMIDTEFYNEVLKNNTSLVNELKDNYDFDLTNYKSLAEAKYEVDKVLLLNLSDAWAKYYNLAATNLQAEADMRRKLGSEVWGYTNKVDQDGNYIKTQERIDYEKAIKTLDENRRLVEERAKLFDQLVKDSLKDFPTKSYKGVTIPEKEKKTKKEEYAEVQKDAYAALNAELAITNARLEELNHLEKLLDKEDYAGRYKVIQERNLLYKEQLNIYERLIKEKQKEANMHAEELKRVKILDQSGKLADNYLEVMENLNSKTLGSVKAVEKVENAFQSWFNLTYSEIPGLNNSLNKVKEELHGISQAAIEARIEIAKMAEDYAKDWLKYSIDREIDNIERLIAVQEEAHNQRIAQLEKELEALKENKEVEDEGLTRAEKLLEIQKQADELERARNRRNLRILTSTGQYAWVAKPEEVAKEQDKLKKLQEDYAKWERDNLHNKLIKQKEEEIQKENEAFENFRLTQQRRIEVLNKTLSEYEIRTNEFFGQMIPGWEEFLSEITIDHTSSFEQMENQVYSLVKAYEQLIETIKRSKEAELIGIQRPIDPNTTYVNAKGQTVGVDIAWNTGLGAATGDVAKANEARLATDRDFLVSEIARTQTVIENRKAQGLSTKEQEAYLKRLQTGSYKDGGQIESTGLHLAEFHGTKDDPEWIFNSTQLAEVIKRSTLKALDIALKPATNFSTVNNSSKLEQVFNIQKLEFPNVRTAEEIEKAILNLPKLARMQVRTL
jgi:TP901 family phage tail tape measure protein